MKFDVVVSFILDDYPIKRFRVIAPNILAAQLRMLARLGTMYKVLRAEAL